MAEPLEKQYTGKKIAQRQEQLIELARGLLAGGGADQIELRIVETDSALTRFAGSQIHQNTLERGATVAITARLGQQEGRAGTNLLTREGLHRALDQAVAAARVSPENPYLADLPDGPREYPFQVDFFEATAGCTPEDRAKQVINGFKVADDPAFTAAGFYATGAQNVLIANSRGVEVMFSTTQAKYSVLWSGPDSSGHAERSSRNVDSIDTPEAAVQALATARRSANPRTDLPPGRYAVVLGPECCATLLNFLGWLAFSGKPYVEGSSAFSGRLGTAVCGTNVSVSDDPLDPRLMAWPCDASGLPKQRLGLIENGVARSVAYDAETAKRAGTASTGHASEMHVPVPGSLVMGAGGESRDTLLREIEQGVYVSRFHYTNVLDPLATTITGMTRDGTFQIEKGQLAGGLTNFRFTQAILPALAKVSGIAADQVLVGAPWGGSAALVPEAVRIDEFNFSGKSDH
jgi:predicted Zn-dependent protease